MSRTLRFCAPDESVSTAEGIMRTYQIRRIPIVDKDRRPVGVLSLADIVRATERKKKGRTTKKVAPAEVAGTLADICAMPPREPPGPRPARPELSASRGCPPARSAYA